jgi:hypothetical protein
MKWTSDYDRTDKEFSQILAVESLGKCALARLRTGI